MPIVGSTILKSCLIKEKKMTNLQFRSLNVPDIHKFALGFDNMITELMRTSNNATNYPPYNVVKHGTDKFTVELAVAGFKDDEVVVTVENGHLIAKGEKSSDVEVEYLHRGISSRSFLRSWALADHVEVTSAVLADGILAISLERIVPEEQKPKRIQITYNK
jgi:molecular chaperone IbpA